MEPLPLHLCKPYKLSSILNSLHCLIHFTALTLLIYHWLSSLASTPLASLPAQLLVFASELLLSLLWLLTQAYLWNSISCTVFPERLPENDQNLPANDVFICTADLKKELPVEVMNTVLSAVPLDYPSKRLHVYLSDDACFALTPLALREAFAFASPWLPYCRMFGIKTMITILLRVWSMKKKERISRPQLKLETISQKISIVSKSAWIMCVKFHLFIMLMQSKYELFKEHIRIAEEEKSSATDEMNPSVLEATVDKFDDEVRANQVQMPLFVYVSREKRPTHPHHFKAGALNCLGFICSSLVYLSVSSVCAG